ncbi:MAG: hypothetical protein MJ187_03510 [Alphaproteobacteria bacterium]|nr:hypothetical protein [Alphaproteobacteria bacterium]
MADVRIASNNSRSTRQSASTPRSSSNSDTTTPNKTRTATTNKNVSERAAVQSDSMRRSSRVQQKTSPAISARTVPQQNARSAQSMLTRDVKTLRVTTTKNEPKRTTARAASITATQNETFGNGVYNSCRDAYFTCMDQFCATQDDAYRRCVCSSRLNDIKQRERALGDTADSLQNFADLNIDVIDKTSNEVKAMISATAGEQVASRAKDTSNSAKTLAGIGDILSKSKSQSLSTNGSLDIAGDINAVWATTDLAGGQTIANLTGEALYNAVHTQCVDMVSSACENTSTLNMVVSAYGMYIENDCSALMGALDKKKTDADKSIRQTEREMQIARLENYDAHNSTSINDCVALVRQDLTMDTACGKDYVHCLDITGLYLNKTTGEPIYTPKFYQLDGSVSLSGDIIKNNTNTLLVSELNRMRSFATQHLNTCTDMADDVWNEFLRQAIREIYQGQQDRIRTVRNECLSVVSTCYDEQAKSLKDFSNIDEQLLLGSRLVTAEEMCKTKLETCSNLYGNGTDGMGLLVDAMHNLTDQKINQNCLATLETYLQQLCAPEAGDHTHTYPWGCRALDIGSILDVTDIKQEYPMFLSIDSNSVVRANSHYQGLQEKYPFDGSNPAGTLSAKGCRSDQFFICNTNATHSTGSIWKRTNDLSTCYPYTGNDAPYYRSYRCVSKNFTFTRDWINCSQNNFTSEELNIFDISKGFPIWAGDNMDIFACKYPLKKSIRINDASGLFSTLKKYAQQVCMRPNSDQLSTTVLQDVSVAISNLKSTLVPMLETECKNLGGVWDSSIQTSQTAYNDILFTQYYNQTAANTNWGFCIKPDLKQQAEDLYQQFKTNSACLSDPCYNGANKNAKCQDNGKADFYTACTINGMNLIKYCKGDEKKCVYDETIPIKYECKYGYIEYNSEYTGGRSICIPANNY